MAKQNADTAVKSTRTLRKRASPIDQVKKDEPIVKKKRGQQKDKSPSRSASPTVSNTKSAKVTKKTMKIELKPIIMRSRSASSDKIVAKNTKKIKTNTPSRSPSPSTAKSPKSNKTTNSSKTTKSKQKKDDAIKVEENEDDAIIVKENEDDAVDASKGKSGGKANSKGKKKKDQVKEIGKENSDSNNVKIEKTGVQRSVVKKGKAPVDGLCPIASSSHVFWEKDEDLGTLTIWDCMLNQTNIQFNNNKFYLIQLLKNDSKDAYSVWMRWGRVGVNGQTSLKSCGKSLENAKSIFEKKFDDKTKNEWSMIDCFEKVPGKYDMLKMDYDQNQDEVDMPIVKQEENPVKIESKLEFPVKSLIELICDIKVMESAVTEMKYDAKKAPLGKITTDQITAGYSALKKIDELIIAGKVSNKDLLEACNAFYTRVPHYFGMRVPPLIRTSTEVREKLKLLEALGDIQAALSIIGQPIDITEHQTDQRYKQLACSISSLPPSGDLYKMLEKYLLSTHGETHKSYKMKVLDIFECTKDMEDKRFNDVGNRKLLWHGSRLSNWAGILGQGLRIAPPEAPVTGYMFGKGVYFADMSSKSANYCCVSRRNNIGFLTLCEVALGKTNELLKSDYNAHKMPKGCHSVLGCGMTAPEAKNVQYLEDGTEVPMGPGVDTGITSSSGYTLQYNEYIIYDLSQIRIRYLMKVQFDY